MFAFIISSFCSAGTSSIGTSTPRSPLAIMMASAACRILFILSTAPALSILATIYISLPFFRANSLVRSIASADSTKEMPKVSIPSSRANPISSRSLFVGELAKRRAPGRFKPFPESSWPPEVTLQATSLFPASMTSSSINPSLR